MTYVTANLHGENERFQSLLRTLNFRDSDVLYVLGDMVDYGEGAMDLITDLSMRLNVFPECWKAAKRPTPTFRPE